MTDDIVIVAAKRTPIGGFLGKMSHLTAIELASMSHLACLESIDIDPEKIDEVIMGCVLSAGLGQAPARQTALSAQLSPATVSSTINKVCGSGMQAIIHAYESIQTGRSNIVLAGGMESMSHAPYLLPKVRNGLRLGHSQCLDHMFLDGLEDAYDKKLMGCYADITAKTLGISREAQDAFAKSSMQKALNAQKKAYFLEELALVLDKDDMHICDEQPKEDKLEKLARLKPAFDKEGSVTAGNSSSIADGAASLILMRQSQALSLGLRPLARISGYAQYAQEPAWFTTAPSHSIQKLLQQLQWNKQDVDLWEINEAFAVVALAAIQDLDLNPEIVNVHGGACALGHPIGASGARIIVTLIYALMQHQKQRGIASICIGGGEALALAVERL